jgi:hypothetical protein
MRRNAGVPAPKPPLFAAQRFSTPGKSLVLASGVGLLAAAELPWEKQRAELLKRLCSVGDWRRGSITATSGKCGKPACHCAQAGSAGHGPNYRLTRKIQGKTVTETFSSPVALKKAQREVAEFHKFQDLYDQVVVVSEQFCSLPLLVPNLGGDVVRLVHLAVTSLWQKSRFGIRVEPQRSRSHHPRLHQHVGVIDCHFVPNPIALARESTAH